MAISPMDPGWFFINYTSTSGNTVIVSYQILDGNPDIAHPNSEIILLTISQLFSNYDGGKIYFGGNGYLYIGMGDGGSGVC